VIHWTNKQMEWTVLYERNNDCDYNTAISQLLTDWVCSSIKESWLILCAIKHHVIEMKLRIEKKYSMLHQGLGLNTMKSWSSSWVFNTNNQNNNARWVPRTCQKLYNVNFCSHLRISSFRLWLLLKCCAILIHNPMLTDWLQMLQC